MTRATRRLLFTLCLLPFLAEEGEAIMEQASMQMDVVHAYGVAEKPWPEELGNHRAVVRLEAPAEAVRLRLLWRRHDPSPEKRRFIIVDAAANERAPNILRLDVNGERCELVFGPAPRAGIYYFYYLPYEAQKGWGFYGKDYPPPEEPPSGEWSASIVGKTQELPEAEVVEIQARTAFDSFYPMEITPTREEKAQFLAQHASDCLVFPEDRRFPIRMRNEIPHRWLEAGPGGAFKGAAQKNEYYCLQLGVYAARKRLQDLSLRFQDLKGPRGAVLPASAMTCFNLEGTDPYGNRFTREVNVEQGAVQALWIGVDVPRDIPAGVYQGDVTLLAAGIDAVAIPVSLEIEDTALEDRGDGEPWRHSRLRWLNSALGIDDDPVRPYGPIGVKGERRYGASGREIKLAPGGLPESILVQGNEILAAPIRLAVVRDSQPQRFAVHGLEHDERLPGKVSQVSVSESPDLRLVSSVCLECDGFLLYSIRIEPKRDLDVDDVRLEIPLRSEIAQYMMGFGRPGSEVPEKFEARWGGPYDSLWLGNAYGGLHCELRGGSYHGPLLNLYHPEPPESWHNGGKGGVSVEKQPGGVVAAAFTGERRLRKNEGLTMEFALLVTPVKRIDTRRQFVERYYHQGGMPSEENMPPGIKVVNVHHANVLNPYINYPFLSVEELRRFAETCHAKGRKVKIYYTIRELTNHVPEIWALRSLGDEILRDGEGGGFPWLREHLVDAYTPQWYHHFDGPLGVDASILTSERASRWYNYYIEGLAWIIQNADVDGLYLDDVAFDRRILKRIRKVMERQKPGCLIDLHSNTGFSIGPATQYAEFFPYVDKLWFGESFDYDNMSPANWLVEVSGIPFGLMGDMLQGGGNPWRGMVYGMTARYPWVTDGKKCEPQEIWKVWDAFGIEDATMVGYWDKKPVVATSDGNVLATAYVKPRTVLVALASWAEEPTAVTLRVNWDALQMDRKKARIRAPYVKNFQEERSFAVGEAIPVAP
ncbi:MAG TPA: glycoside hydrolase domain-containing protein, partial [Sumerlaeia bacterium]|nr:glycoside hydrolase domain-containing protein [Sumerlaeia bacterium]